MKNILCIQLFIFVKIIYIYKTVNILYFLYFIWTVLIDEFELSIWIPWVHKVDLLRYILYTIWHMKYDMGGHMTDRSDIHRQIWYTQTDLIYTDRYTDNIYELSLGENEIKCNPMQCNAMMQCNSSLYNTMQCNTMQCNAMQWN